MINENVQAMALSLSLSVYDHLYGKKNWQKWSLNNVDILNKLIDERIDKMWINLICFYK